MWEYKVLPIDGLTSENLTSEVNDLGSLGWELVCQSKVWPSRAYDQPNYTLLTAVLIFKRPQT
jgi:hypothetical protein